MIKNIIFDVGNVLMGYRWKEMLLEHGLDEKITEKVGTTVFEEKLWDIFDKGLISMEELIQSYGEKYPELKEEISWFLGNSEQMLLPRPDVWEKLALLKEKGYYIYLLSNYSEELFERHINCTPILDYVDGKVVSYEIQRTKPDPEIYLHLLEKYNIAPEESIFFDDLEANVHAAKKLGIRSITISSKEQLLEEMDVLLK